MGTVTERSRELSGPAGVSTTWGTASTMRIAVAVIAASLNRVLRGPRVSRQSGRSPSILTTFDASLSEWD
jgi:hypothetical protein